MVAVAAATLAAAVRWRAVLTGAFGSGRGAVIFQGYWNDPDAPDAAGKVGAEYVHVPGAEYICAECCYFDAAKRDRCWPVLGTISPGGSCNKWTP